MLRKAYIYSVRLYFKMKTLFGYVFVFLFDLENLCFDGHSRTKF